MPDLQPFNRFSRSMITIERQFEKDVTSLYRVTRERILGIVSERNIQDPSVMMAIRPLFEELKRNVERLAQDYTEQLRFTANTMTESELDMLAAVRDGIPSLDDVLFSVSVPTVDAVNKWLTGASGWVDVVAANFAVELARLQNSNEPDEAIMRRLLSTRLVDDRVSEWRRGRNLMSTEIQGALWTAAMAFLAINREAGQSLAGQQWRKQAIATIDERTTDTCLRVHGQIQALNSPFHLTGTPKFSTFKHNSPFHWKCRTATVLYVEEFEAVGITTLDMRDAARAEIVAREQTGRRETIHPSSATSRRTSRTR